jgi:hypothetical protein
VEPDPGREGGDPVSTLLAESDRLVATSKVVVEEMEKEVLLLDLDQDLCFGLNDTGRMIWDGIVRGRTLGETVNDIAAATGGPRETVAGDVLAFAALLLDRHLVKRA